MKIGIITYHAVYNFGANLQILSTVGYLKKHGYEPRVIDWMPVDLERKYDKGTPQEQVEAHKNFQKEYLPLTKRCRNSKEISAICIGCKHIRSEIRSIPWPGCCISPFIGIGSRTSICCNSNGRIYQTGEVLC